MKKIRLSIEEVLKYRREMVIEIPEGMSEDELHDILDRVERRSFGVSDIPYALKKFDIKTIEHPNEDLDSPNSADVEIDDYDFID